LLAILAGWFSTPTRLYRYTFTLNPQLSEISRKKSAALAVLKKVKSAHPNAYLKKVSIYMAGE